MPQQSGLQSRKQMHTLLTQGRQVAADAAEDSGSCLTAEGARHLLLDFDHAYIPFRLVVVKGVNISKEEKCTLSKTGGLADLSIWLPK